MKPLIRISNYEWASWLLLLLLAIAPSAPVAAAYAMALSAACFERYAEGRERSERESVESRIAEALTDVHAQIAELESKVSAVALQAGMRRG